MSIYQKAIRQILYCAKTDHVLSPNRWFVGYQPTICYNKTDYVLLLKKTIA